MSDNKQANEKTSTITTEAEEPTTEITNEEPIALDPRDPSEVAIEATLAELNSELDSDLDPPPTTNSPSGEAGDPNPTSEEQAGTNPPSQQTTSDDDVTTEPAASQPMNGFTEDDELGGIAQDVVDQESSAFTKEERDYLQTLITDPKRLVDDTAQKVMDKLETVKAERKHADDQWNGFYQKNPELKAHKNLVDLVKNEVANTYRANPSTFNWNDALKKVADKSKGLVSSIRSEQYEEVDTEASSEVTVVSSSGNPTPRQVKKPGKRSFIEQVKANKAL